MYTRLHSSVAPPKAHNSQRQAQVYGPTVDSIPSVNATPFTSLYYTGLLPCTGIDRRHGNLYTYSTVDRPQSTGKGYTAHAEGNHARDQGPS